MSHLSTTAASHHYSSEVLLSDVENRNVMDTMGINQTIGGKVKMLSLNKTDPQKYKISITPNHLKSSKYQCDVSTAYDWRWPSPSPSLACQHFSTVHSTVLSKHIDQHACTINNKTTQLCKTNSWPLKCFYLCYFVYYSLRLLY